MNRLLILWLILFTYKLVSNSVRYVRCLQLKGGYYRWLNGENPGYPTYRQEVVSLFKSAGASNIGVPVVKPMGFGRLASFKAQVFDQFPSNDYEIGVLTIRVFDEAIGTYRKRSLESLNPLYWIELVLFAPRNLLMYLDLDTEKAAFKILNVLLSGIWWIVITLTTIFQDSLQPMVINLIEVLL